MPSMQETQIDAKRDLDQVLKTACLSLKSNAVKMLLGPLAAFLVKVVAFAGEIDTQIEAEETTLARGPAQLNPAQATALKQQAFVRADRLLEMLESVLSQLNQAAPDLNGMMKLYIENNTARSILLRPILQEFDLTRKKMVRTFNIVDVCIVSI